MRRSGDGRKENKHNWKGKRRLSPVKEHVRVKASPPKQIPDTYILSGTLRHIDTPPSDTETCRDTQSQTEPPRHTVTPC
jgi:hypothetical protein